MGVGVGNTVKAFSLFYESLWRSDFRKSLRLNAWSERQLLPLMRTFLLGYFGESIVPEASSALPGALTGKGRLDFIVGDVAVEFVVRRPKKRRDCLLAKSNNTEVKKLLKHNGHALLILYDSSRDPLSNLDLEGFRKLPALGRGPHYKSPFNIAYFHRASARPFKAEVIQKTIRVN